MKCWLSQCQGKMENFPQQYAPYKDCWYSDTAGSCKLLSLIFAIYCAKEENNEMLGLECSTVCSRDVDIDADRQKKIRSL